MTDDTMSESDGIDRRRVAHVIAAVVLVAVIGIFVAAAVPQLVGADESYVVLSDSMSPAIEAGAIVFVSDVPADRISEGDVITFEQSGGSGSENRVTHRVVAVLDGDGEPQFQTQGDANDSPDPQLVDTSAVIGVVQFHVPYVGYVSSFAQTRLGILLLIIVPALLLIASELWDVYNAATVTEDEDQSRGDEN